LINRVDNSTKGYSYKLTLQRIIEGDANRVTDSELEDLVIFLDTSLSFFGGSGDNPVAHYLIHRLNQCQDIYRGRGRGFS
jgi:hypothetical protein